jgi:hypothetical protein
MRASSGRFLSALLQSFVAAVNSWSASLEYRHAYKFNVRDQLPFLKAQKGFVGHALGGWSQADFYQLYSGHLIDVYDGRTRFHVRRYRALHFSG